MTQAQVSESEATAHGRKVAIIAARFNDFIVASLLKGARASWEQRGGAPAPPKKTLSISHTFTIIGEVLRQTEEGKLCFT